MVMIMGKQFLALSSSSIYRRSSSVYGVSVCSNPIHLKLYCSYVVIELITAPYKKAYTLLSTTM